MRYYLELEQLVQKIVRINNIISLLYWDISTIMPSGTASTRINEISNLQSIKNSILISNKMQKLLDQSFDHADKLNMWQLANLEQVNRRMSQALLIDTITYKVASLP